MELELQPRSHVMREIERKVERLLSDIEDCIGYIQLHLQYGDDEWLDYANDIDGILDKIHKLGQEFETRKAIERPMDEGSSLISREAEDK